MINRVILEGYVGAAPEIRSFEGGSRMARIRMATTERVMERKTQQMREHTEWHTVIFWGEAATLVDCSVDKGTHIYIEGALRSRKWRSRDGVEHNTVEVAGTQIKILSQTNSAQSIEKPQEKENITPPVRDVDDIPF